MNHLRFLDWDRDHHPQPGETSLFGEPAAFRRGLYQIADGVWAWMQPNGSWGESNAGIVSDGGESVVFDSLYDVPLTQAMRRAMEPIIAAAPVTTLVNSHSNGDHTYGNQVFADSTIVSSKRCAEEMPEEDPKAARVLPVLGKTIAAAGSLGHLIRPDNRLQVAGKFLSRFTAPYDFGTVRLTMPTKTFTTRLDGTVGSVPYQLLEVGPAHTDGDVMMYLPQQKVLFAGDIIFVDSAPAAWNHLGIERWVDVLDDIMAMDVETIVPGHGPLISRHQVAELRDYFALMMERTKDLHGNGMGPARIADTLLLKDLDFSKYLEWDSPERTVMCTTTYSRVLDGHTDAYSLGEKLKLIWNMAQLASKLHNSPPRVLHRDLCC